MSRDPYPTDLTDTEWARLRPLLTPPPREEVRELVNAMLYVLNGGCGGDLLPHEFPPWGAVTQAVQQWQQDGTWKRLAAAWEQAGLVPSGASGAALLTRRVVTPQ